MLQTAWPPECCIAALSAWLINESILVGIVWGRLFETTFCDGRVKDLIVRWFFLEAEVQRQMDRAVSLLFPEFLRDQSLQRQLRDLAK